MEERNLYFSEEIETLLSSLPQKEVEECRRAFAIAIEKLSGQERGDGSPFLNHLTTVAEIILFEIGLFAPALSAYFLHEATREEGQIDECYQKLFTSEVLLMADSLNQISKIKLKETRLQASNYRELILSYSSDPRVTLIKLADRMEIMRNLDLFSKAKQLQKATETLFLYAPLAHQLGLYNIKSEMEDSSLRYSDTESYRFITNRLKAAEGERERFFKQFLAPIEKALQAQSIVYRVKSRSKSAYSIYKKMQKQQISFDEVADLYAIRIIIESPLEKEKELCWQVYSVVTDLYSPDTSRMRDWLTLPKENGYESLHITVSNNSGDKVEVQIRSDRMDQIAERGVAAHWSYKGVERIESMDRWLNDVKKLMERGRVAEGYKELSLSLNEIFVFTPNGDLKKLSRGASVLDFAFHIHSNIGVRCSGAKVNGKAVSIREQLKTGDVVEILTNRNQKPTADWLKYVVSSKAKTKIRQKLNEEESRLALLGRETLERRLRNWKFRFNDDTVSFLLKHYKFKTASELYSAIAKEELDLITIKGLLQQREEGAPTESVDGTHLSGKKVESSSQPSDSSYMELDGSLKNIDVKFAKCCNPVVGDDVFGFITIKEGIKIHRFSCPNASRLLTNYPYRVQKVKWKKEGDMASFQASLKLIGYGQATGAQDIIGVIDGLGAVLRRFEINERGGEIEAHMELVLRSHKQLDLLLANLRKLKGVKCVKRVMNG